VNGSDLFTEKSLGTSTQTDLLQLKRSDSPLRNRAGAKLCGARGSGRDAITRNCTRAAGAASMKYVTNQFFADESGATAIEYALLAALIAVAIITAITVVGTQLQNTFNEVSSNLK
jgi:pilus assembly protein Flp/PilA